MKQLEDVEETPVQIDTLDLDYEALELAKYSICEHFFHKTFPNADGYYEIFCHKCGFQDIKRVTCHEYVENWEID